ncbi:unnamed protein product [Hyaloperonospora brassicae]|uniref:Uncharacterized protein n=1 Tax=Hyaloperonospora brassicae TaxID=162125 RepID=A0AAV0U5B6_HYABA|nr:unnamed protein product [Hyaloperonospora brassicae]
MDIRIRNVPFMSWVHTVKICLSLQYAPELVHVFVLDDGNTGSVWDANDHLKVTMNSNVIEICGDLRGNLARLMHERVVGLIKTTKA